MRHIALTLTIVVLGSSIFSGCGNNDKQAGGLPEIGMLYADSIQVPPVLLSVTSMFIMGNDTLVAYQGRNDTLFSFWSFPEFKLLSSAGIRGQGGDDFLELDRNFQPTEGGFRAFEISSRRLKDVSLTDNGQLSVSSKNLELDFVPNRFLFLKDDTYCFFSMNGDYEFGLYNEKEGLRYFGTYPNVTEQKEGIAKVLFFNKLTVAHPSGDMFAAFYANMKLCRIYSNTGELLYESMSEHPVKLQDNLYKMHYSMQPFASQDYIYTLTTEGSQCILEVWNWEAELMERYLLDKPIDKFVLKDNVLYGVNPEEEDFIYCYDLSD